MKTRLLALTAGLLLACHAEVTSSSDSSPPATRAASARASAHGAGFLEMRVNDWGKSRYIRVERTGYVEFARHDFTRIKVFRAGVPERPLADAVFRAFYAHGVDRFRPAPVEPDGTPAIDPSDVRLEVRDGDIERVLIYRVSHLSKEVREFHDFVLETSFSFPPNPLKGDYLRQYVIEDRSIVPAGAKIREVDAAALRAMPAVRECVRFPGRVIWAGKADGASLRRWPDLDPAGCFVEIGGTLHRFSVFKWE